jgi:pSer/pThr/pTyr-binding forkhead associated (FHA) protein
MSVELIATKNSDSALLESFPAVIGRRAGSSVQVDESIPAGYHCLVSVVEGQLVVWDLGTVGGTFVNGTRVTKAALKPGDTLNLGGTDFQVNYKPLSRRYLFGVRS